MNHEMEQKWKQDVEMLMDRIKKIEDELKANGSLASSVNVTEAEMQYAYNLGYHFFQQKKYEKALTVFEALHALDPLNKDYAKGVAATMQLDGNLAEAAIQYLMAYFFHPDELEFILLAGRCMVEAGEVAQPYFLLNAVVEAKRYTASDINKKHLETIRVLLEGLRKTMEEGSAKQKRGSKVVAS